VFVEPLIARARATALADAALGRLRGALAEPPSV
jgi:hypothetical protein